MFEFCYEKQGIFVLKGLYSIDKYKHQNLENQVFF